MPVKLDKTDIQLRTAISKRLKQLREQSGKTQQDFAHETGRDKQAYNKNETGKGASIYMIGKFCADIGITLKEFFDSPLFKK